LATGIVSAFHMVSFATLLADTVMRLFGKDLLVGIPKVAESTTLLVFFRDAFPQFATGLFTAISDHKRHDLACPTTKGDPEPTFIHFFQDK